MAAHHFGFHSIPAAIYGIFIDATTGTGEVEQRANLIGYPYPLASSPRKCVSTRAA